MGKSSVLSPRIRPLVRGVFGSHRDNMKKKGFLVMTIMIVKKRNNKLMD